MATDRDIEQFICDSFASIWDLELLSLILEEPDRAQAAPQLVERMRASELVVERGIESLVAAGMASIDAEGLLRFQPVNADVARRARAACKFYSRFPDRTRRLMISRQSPGLTAFADAFRLRKD